jgi:FkbM family methyltransferase
MNGVVHVGAHHGEEVPEYLAEGRAPIICFEPQFSYPAGTRVSWHQIALGCSSCEQQLRVPHHIHTDQYLDTQMASLLPIIPERFRANGLTPTDFEIQNVKVMRFDEWAKLHNFKRGSCDLLKIDAHGMELQVLLGFGDYLDDFSNIVVECSNPPIYEGGYSAVDVASYLGAHGFIRSTPILKLGDVEFRRKLQ